MLAYDPAVQFLGIYTEKTISSKETSKVPKDARKIPKDTMFIAALFTIARIWRQD